MFNLQSIYTIVFHYFYAVRPRILSTIQRFYASIGKEGVVKCAAVGLPPPKFSWKWYEGGYQQILSNQDGLVGKFKVKTVHSFDNSTSYLIIKNVEDVDLRTYECEVKRGDITKSTKMRLYGYGKVYSW